MSSKVSQKRAESRERDVVLFPIEPAAERLQRDRLLVDQGMTIDFQHFKDEIDSHHDRRERVIKISRDITALSKKIIFSLHRIPIEPVLKDDDAVPAQIGKEIARLEAQIHDLASKASIDLQALNHWRYERNITGAIQEFVEALTFRYYIQHQTVPTYDETRVLVGQNLSLTEADYVLGIADLTGELARRAITAVSGTSEDSQIYTARIASTLRQICGAFEMIDAHSDQAYRELSKKMEVMRTSIKKVETSIFERAVKGRTLADSEL